MRASVLASFLSIVAVALVPRLALAAEEEPEAAAPEAAPPAEAPPTTAPPATPPPAAPPQQLAPTTAPTAQPVPTWGAPAPAPETPPQADQPSEPEPPEEEGTVIPRWQIAIGARTAFVTHPGYDPFSEDNRLIQFSLGGSRSLYTQGLFSIAGAAYYDGSSVESTARGEATELEIHRFALGPEFRAHVLPMLYAFARPSAALMRSIARLDETTTGTTLSARAWTFGFDAVAGVAFRAISFGRGENAARLWLIGEGGYGWSSSSDLRLAPDSDDDSAPQRVAEVDLGTLAVRGPMFRILAATTF